MLWIKEVEMVDSEDHHELPLQQESQSGGAKCTNERPVFSVEDRLRT